MELLIGIIVGLAVMEIGDRHKQIVSMIVRLATKALPYDENKKQRCQEEWTANALAAGGRLSAILHAVGCVWAAGSIWAAHRVSRKGKKARSDEIAPTKPQHQNQPFFWEEISGEFEDKAGQNDVFKEAVKVWYKRGWQAASEELKRNSQTTDPVLNLTIRELECLFWAAQGYTTAGTSVALSISPETVKNHIQSARTKLGTKTTIQTIEKAAELGILNLE